MFNIIGQNRKLFFLLIILTSCNNYHNRQKMHAITALENKTTDDFYNLTTLMTNDIENVLKIAEFNLSKIEDKKLDSIAMELIYFEYREYLQCVNIIYGASQEIENLKSTIVYNTYIKNK